MRIQRRKLRQTGEIGGADAEDSGADDDEEFEESMSMYEEEDPGCEVESCLKRLFWKS